LAARVRERALADAREHVNVLMKELANDHAELRSRDARIADLESQVEDYRKQVALLVTRAVTRNRALKAKKSRPVPRAKLTSKTSIRPKKPAQSKRTRRRTKR
jgi:hypothetical protein